MPTQIEQIKNLDPNSSDWYMQYPWFCMGHLIHANNQKEESIFWSTAQKTAVFFNDEQRLHYLLHEKPINKSGLLRQFNIGVIEEEQEMPQQFQSRLPKHVAPEINVEQHIIEEISLAEKGPLEQNTADKIIEPFAESIPSIGETNIIEPITTTEETQTGKNDQASDTDEITVDENDDLEEYGKIASDEGRSLQETEDTIKSELRIKSVLDNQQSSPLIEFEPYHTIDYFASQGIKVDLKMDDRLGKQLKTFTSWLKTMKRLPTVNDVGLSNESGTTVIKTDNSLENIAVVTEAMAEVLIKQGKKEQAMEIYQKLGLFHPEKSHYFAAQIEQLKN